EVRATDRMPVQGRSLHSQEFLGGESPGRRNQPVGHGLGHAIRVASTKGEYSASARPGPPKRTAAGLRAPPAWKAAARSPARPDRAGRAPGGGAAPATPPS